MTHGAPRLLEALRLPELYRLVWVHSGLPLPPAPGGERFVVRCGAEPPGLFAALLAEAVTEDEAAVAVWPADVEPDYRSPPPGGIAVRPGLGPHREAADAVREAMQPSAGRVLLFAVERRDAEGRTLGVTWAAVSEEEPPSQEPYRAAVLRLDGDDE